MSDPFISFIIPTYNAQKTIKICLQSIIDCDYPSDKKEIIVVNNNSTDLTAEILSGLPVTVLMETRQGRSMARNAGARVACGEIFAFIDADCKINKNWAKEIIKSFVIPDVGASQGPIIPICDNQENFLSRFRRYQSAQLTGGSHILLDVISFKLPMINSACCAYSKIAFEFAGGFDENLERHEDIDLSRRVFNAGFSVKSSPMAIAEVFWHGEGWKDFYSRSIAHGKTLVNYDKKWGIKSPFSILYHFTVSKILNLFSKLPSPKNIVFGSIDNFFTLSSLITYQLSWPQRNYSIPFNHKKSYRHQERYVNVDQDRFIFPQEINFLFLEKKALIKNIDSGIVIETDQVYHFFLNEIMRGNGQSFAIIASCLDEFSIEEKDATQYFNNFIAILRENKMIIPASVHD